MICEQEKGTVMKIAIASVPIDVGCGIYLTILYVG